MSKVWGYRLICRCTLGRSGRCNAVSIMLKCSIHAVVACDMSLCCSMSGAGVSKRLELFVTDDCDFLFDITTASFYAQEGTAAMKVYFLSHLCKSFIVGSCPRSGRCPASLELTQLHRGYFASALSFQASLPYLYLECALNLHSGTFDWCQGGEPGILHRSIAALQHCPP